MKGPAEDIISSAETSNQRDVDFSDYMWMGEEMEEFDKKCIQEFCEQDFIESCFEELFEEEDRFAEELELYLESLTPDQVGQLVLQLDAVTLDEKETTAVQTCISEGELDGAVQLNPDAPVFIPITDAKDRPDDQ